MSIRVRKVLAADVSQIAMIHNASWQRHYASILPAGYLRSLSVSTFEKQWAARVARSDATEYLVVTIGERVAGFSAAGPMNANAGPGEIYGFYTLVEGWSPAAPAVLLRATVRSLVRRQFEPIHLWVLAANERGRRFFEAAGFLPDEMSRRQDFGGASVEVLRYRLASRNYAQRRAGS